MGASERLGWVAFCRSAAKQQRHQVGRCRRARSPHGVVGAAIALVAVILPGVLLVYVTLPYCDAFRARPLAQAAMRGTNAALIGILGLALYNPVWTCAIVNPRDFAVAALAFVLLTVAKVPPWIAVVLTALGGVVLVLLRPGSLPSWLSPPCSIPAPCPPLGTYSMHVARTIISTATGRVPFMCRSVIGRRPPSMRARIWLRTSTGAA